MVWWFKSIRDLATWMKRIENDVFIFITYHKEESQDEKNYVDGKPDYADAFEDNLIFKWDSQIGKGLDSSYMKDVLGADRKHLFVKKSDAETSFYYMGQFDVLAANYEGHYENASCSARGFIKILTVTYYGIMVGGIKDMKTIKVVAAVICDNIKEKNKIFATARGYGELKGGWEFPGGKVEPGETPQQALVREIMEELDTEIKVGEWIDTIEFDYPTFHLSMDCFWAEVTKGHLELKEAEAAKWLTKDQLDSVAWLPADITLIDKIQGYMK